MTHVFTWPVGRAPHSPRPWRPPPFAPIAVYTVIATASGAMTGLLIAEAGALLTLLAHGLPVAIAGALGVVAMASEMQLRMRPLPQARRQVPRHWTLWPNRVKLAAAFGLQIGAGALTYLEYATAYTLAAILLVAPHPLLGLAVGAIYGAGRAASLDITWLLDRRGRQRVDWDRLIPARPLVGRSLAVIGAVSLGAVLVL